MSQGEAAKTKESKSKQTKQHKPASKQEEAYLVLEATSCTWGSEQSWRLEAARDRVREAQMTASLVRVETAM